MAHRFFRLENRYMINLISVVVVCTSLTYITWLNLYDSIADVSQNPGQFSHVWLRGYAHNAYAIPLLGSVYHLEDPETGSGIWVISKIDSITPEKRLFIRGQVVSELPLHAKFAKELSKNINSEQAGPFLIETERSQPYAVFERLSSP